MIIFKEELGQTWTVAVNWLSQFTLATSTTPTHPFWTTFSFLLLNIAWAIGLLVWTPLSGWMSAVAPEYVWTMMLGNESRDLPDEIMYWLWAKDVLVFILGELYIVINLTVFLS